MEQLSKQVVVSRSTGLWHEAPKPEDIVTATRRPYTLVTRLPRSEFKKIKLGNMEPVFKKLKTLQDYLTAKKLSKRKPTRSVLNETRSVETSLCQKVNNKRQKIAAILQSQSKPVLTKVALQCQASYELVKKVEREMAMLGSASEFRYPNQHTSVEMVQLSRTLSTVHNTFKTIQDIKKENPSFSRKFIARELHQRGLKWKEVPRAPFTPKERGIPPDPENICYVITNQAEILSRQDTVLIFMDEMKLHLYQTAPKHWTFDKMPDTRQYDDRPSQRLITALAACTVEGFIAVNLVDGEVNSNDTAEFLERLIESQPNDKRYVILLDNATWHKSKLMNESDAWRFLLFNEKRQYKLNLIENAFSYVRDFFRKRPEFESREEEMRHILNIFFDSKQKERFEGFHRNHIRNLISMATQYSAKLKQPNKRRK